MGKKITAYEFIRSIPWIPSNDDGDRASNSDIRRWFDRKAVIINGVKPDWRDEITLPVHELVFFPKGKRKTTMVKAESGTSYMIDGWPVSPEEYAKRATSGTEPQPVPRQ